MEYKTGTFIMGRCSVVVTKPGEYYQMIIIGKEFKPSYNEVIKARYKYLPDDITMAQIFPPKEDYQELDKSNAHILIQLAK